MKRLSRYLSLLALAVSLALVPASCSKDTIIEEVGPMPEPEYVSIDMQVCSFRLFDGPTPYVYQLGHGDKVVSLAYAIYDSKGVMVASSDDPETASPLLTKSTAPIFWTFTQQLRTDETYRVLLWADRYGKGNKANPYTLNLADRSITVDYYKALNAADCAADFTDGMFAYEEMTIDRYGIPNRTYFALRRPFCQVNLISYAENMWDDTHAGKDKFAVVPLRDGATLTATELAFTSDGLGWEASGSYRPGLHWPLSVMQDIDLHTGNVMVTGSGVDDMAQYLFSAMFLPAGTDTETLLPDSYLISILTEGASQPQILTIPADHPAVSGTFGTNRMVCIDASLLPR